LRSIESLRWPILLLMLDLADTELARAQFRSFAKQMPLLYAILICNAAAIMIDFFRSEFLLRTCIAPAIICAVALSRAVWWLRQTESKTASDKQIARRIRLTCNLSVILTMAFELWGMWIYDLGDAYSRGHLIFFLALTEVSTIFCLMSIRAAAMRVAVITMFWSASYFSWIDHGRMLIESIVMCLVGGGMMVVTHRYNRDFSQMIHSRRDLRVRQIETERLSVENRRVALTDALSGLPNRRQLLARLEQLENGSELPADSLAVVYIDLDGFKEINDAHGHQAGDVLIGSLSARLSEACPPYAMLARVGGDEFAIVIEASEASANAGLLAERLRDEICLPVLVDRHVLQVGSSIGIAGNSNAPLAPYELLRRADTAMYHVKTHGKGGIAVYVEAFDEGRLHRLAIEAQIGRGLADHEFDVFYQPVVDAESGIIVGAEALIRWPRRSDGPLDPEQFIEIAEATGQIHSMGLFVLERACRDFKALGDLKLSVNVSPAQFRDSGFERQVTHILEQTRFPPERLQFEITEGYLLSHTEMAINGIRAFRAMGISIALDDFGTGFTSIHYLQSYGFSHIKIDKSLLIGLHPASKTSMLITGAVLLAKGLDMRVIAEGVETREQADLLRAAGCHKLQGYFFGRPMPLADFKIFYGARADRCRIRTSALGC